jgi:hypothetical protein
MTPLQQVVRVPGLSADPRWQLVERVVSSASFQKSNRLRDLLYHLAERSISGHANELTEQRIGHVVFGKPAAYSPNEDSSVRVHVRQLRLKLHEYFDVVGRNDSLIIEIPKGAYAPVFRTLEAGPATTVVAPVAEEPSAPRFPSRSSIYQALPWLVSAALAGFCCYLLAGSSTPVPSVAPWPLSEVFHTGLRTQIVVADVNYGMLRVMTQKPGSLEDYLSPNFQQSFSPAHPTERESRILNALEKTRHASYADVAIVAKLMQMVGDSRDQVFVRSARDLNLRDIEEGNVVLLGSAASNPWVSLFAKKLNFQEREAVAGQSLKSFVNQRPEGNEPASYEGLHWSANGGEDYSTISVLPNGKSGSVLILQGLHGEGTEGAGMFLGNAENRQRLREALGVRVGSQKPVYFEALLQTSIVAGAPKSARIVAQRLLEK